MKKLILTHTLAVLLGASIGFTLACWAFVPLHLGPPKYKLNDFRKVPPIEPFSGFTTERQWEFKCIGTDKDCGQPVSIPEPGTIFLFGIGLVLLAARNIQC